MRGRRWSRCILQCDETLERFLDRHIGGVGRHVFLLGAAGFDPRSTGITERLAALPRMKITALWVRERRPVSLQPLHELAEANLARLLELVPGSRSVDLSIFASDGATIGGREIVRLLQTEDLSNVSDIAIDVSALSTGILYTATKYLYECVRRQPKLNLHLFLRRDAAVDFRIRGTPSDAASLLHGYRGSFTLDTSARAARLWLPQLVPGRSMMLQGLHAFLDPHEVCPVLPCLSDEPRLADSLVEEYRDVLAAWDVDFRNLLYASERDPRDLYDKISRLHATRERVFGSNRGSQIVLSPTGSKTLALGALLAALEFDLPVTLFESIGYELLPMELPLPSNVAKTSRILHLWLHGEAYR